MTAEENRMRLAAARAEAGMDFARAKSRIPSISDYIELRRRRSGPRSSTGRKAELRATTARGTLL